MSRWWQLPLIRNMYYQIQKQHVWRKNMCLRNANKCINTSTCEAQIIPLKVAIQPKPSSAAASKWLTWAQHSSWQWKRHDLYELQCRGWDLEMSVHTYHIAAGLVWMFFSLKWRKELWQLCVTLNTVPRSCNHAWLVGKALVIHWEVLGDKSNDGFYLVLR